MHSLPEFWLRNNPSALHQAPIIVNNKLSTSSLISKEGSRHLQVINYLL